jgi:predicted transcriptional regulator
MQTTYLTIMTLRLPTDLAQWLDTQAQAQHRSRHAQILHLLRLVQEDAEMRHLAAYLDTQPTA